MIFFVSHFFISTNMEVYVKIFPDKNIFELLTFIQLVILKNAI